MLSRTLAVAKQNDMRQHPRVPLVLWVRVRWLGVLGLEPEVSETIDTGRGGLLTSSACERAPGSPAWVTFPYDSNAAEAVPEFPSRVAHCNAACENSFHIGLAFLSDHHPEHANRGNHRAFPAKRKLFWRRSRNSVGPLERRTETRIPIALPVTIHRESLPWPDETMTADVSSSGISFSTVQVYEPDELLSVNLPDGRWAASGRHSARVVRVSAGGTEVRLQTVAVRFV